MKTEEKATARELPLIAKLIVWYIKNPVLVYTMGKVGSSSIVNTLRALELDEVQPHSLTLSRRGSYFVLPKRMGLKVLKDIIKSRLLKVKGRFYFFTKKLTKKKVKVVTLVRDPLARTISAYFEQYQYVLNQDINSVSTSDLIDNFFKFANHNTPHIWFDNEIMEMLNIDVYSSSFNKNLGCKFIKTKRFDMLLIKMESLSSLSNELAEFFNVKEFVLKTTNRSEFKVYKQAYDQFKKEIIFPKEYLDFHYNSKYVKHFYSEDEIAGFRARWNESHDS